MAELVNEPNTPTGPIRIPEWDDVIHVKPRAALTSADKRAWKAYLDDTGSAAVPVAQLRRQVEAIYDQGGDVGGLTRDQVDAALRGRQIYQDMQMSEVPQWRQKMIRVLTTLDNIEDDVSTVEWITRPLTSKWAPTRVLSEITRRFTKGVDGIEKVIAGPTLANALKKRKSANSRRRSARAAKGKLSKVATGAKWISDNFGHLLEAGQSLDNHLGVGIQLGAIFGALEEVQDRLIISAWEGSKFVVASSAMLTMPETSPTWQSLYEQQQASARRVEKVGGAMVDQVADFLARERDRILDPNLSTSERLRLIASRASPAFGLLDRLITKATGGAELQRDNDTYTRAEHALALYTSAVTTPALAEAYHLTAAQIDPARIAELDAPAPRLTNELSRELARLAGVSLTADGRPTGQYQERTVSLRAHLERAIDDSIRARSTWLPQSVDADPEQLLHSLLEANRQGTALMLTGREDGLRVTPDPETRAEVLMYHLDAQAPAGTPRAVLEAWMRSQVAAIDADPDGYDAARWAQITRRYWPIPHLERP